MAVFELILSKIDIVEVPSNYRFASYEMLQEQEGDQFINNWMDPS
jgi:hypothetical protein